MCEYLDNNFEDLFQAGKNQDQPKPLQIEKNGVECVTNIEDAVIETQVESPSPGLSIVPITNEDDESSKVIIINDDDESSKVLSTNEDDESSKVLSTNEDDESSKVLNINEDDESAKVSIDFTEHFTTDQIFHSKDDIVKWCEEVGRKNKSVVVIHRSERAEPGKKARLDFACERSGFFYDHRKKGSVIHKEESEKKKRKSPGTKKCGCPFKLRGIPLPDGKWKVKVTCGSHNHVMERPVGGRSYVGRLTDEERQILINLTGSGVKSDAILTTLKTRSGDNRSTMRTVYNERKKLRVTGLEGKSAMQQLVKFLQDQHYVYFQRLDQNTNSVISIFWAHPNSVKLAKVFHKVLMLDCSFKTNKYNMPLLEIVGVASTGMTFSIAFCFTQSDTQEHYTWALSCLRSLFDENGSPQVLVTDRDLALINAVNEVFPAACRLLCTRHISKDILTHCKKIILEDKEWVSFESDWTAVTRAPTEDGFFKLWDQFQASWVRYSDCVKYIKDTWVGEKEHFVEAWTNMVKHYGSTTSNRCESFDSRLKKHIRSGSGSFQTIWIAMHNMIIGEITEVKGSFEKSQHTVMNEHEIGLFKELKGRVSHYALDKLCHEVTEATHDGQLGSNCLHVLRNTYGLPCVHEIVHYLLLEHPIPLNEIDSQWKHLSVEENVMVVYDEVDLSEPLEKLKEKWKASNEYERQMIRAKLLEIVSPVTTSDHEPIHQIAGNLAVEPVNLSDYQDLAKQALPKMYYDYYEGGAEDQHTLKENMEAFRRITFQPRILVDVSRIDMSTKILGYNVSSPIMIAPTAYHKLAHPEGEIATAKAAASCNTIMVLSFMSTSTVEEVASSCDAIRFFQLYVYKRRDISAKLVERAEKSGYKAIVLTADTPRLGRREADIKNKMVLPRLKNFEGLLSTEVVFEKGSNLEAFAAETFDPSFSWKDIGWLKSITDLPILIKGVLTAEDAKKAVEVGFAGLIVSNHGARQLDYAPATISVLEEVVQAVGGKVPVFFDGGVRRGTDVFKALALGAQAVLIGRPVIYGLAAKGEHGVREVIEMLKKELENTMALCGCTSLKNISRSHVRQEHERLQSSI